MESLSSSFLLRQNSELFSYTAPRAGMHGMSGSFAGTRSCAAIRAARTQVDGHHALGLSCDVGRKLSTRPLVPRLETSSWRFCPYSTESGHQQELQEEPRTPLSADDGLIRRTNTPPRHSYGRLRTGSARHELGTKLRQALREGRDPAQLLGDDTRSQRLWGISTGGSQRKKQQVRKKLEHVAAATATLGKYHGASVTSQYAQDSELSNEIDQILREDGRNVEAFEEEDRAPRLHIRKTDEIRQMSKPSSPSWEQLSDFERRLFRNPYARQLADPLRKCMFTGARLPSPLLSQFDAKFDTEGGAIWAVPSEFIDRSRDLRNERVYMVNGDPLSLHAAVPYIEYIQAEKSESDNHDQDSPDKPLEAPHRTLFETEFAVRPLRRAYPSQNASSSAEQTPGEDTKYRLHTRGMNTSRSKMFVLANMSMLSHVPDLHGQRTRKAFPPRWRERMGNQLVATINLRPDMAQFVLKLMRRKAARFLANLDHVCQSMVLPMQELQTKPFRSRAGVLSTTVPDYVGEPVTKRAAALVGAEDAAAILWFGDSWGAQFPYSDDMLSDKTLSHDVASRVPEIPIYNMQTLFSKIEWDWLRSLEWRDGQGLHQSGFGNSQILVKESIWSGRTVGLLWRFVMSKYSVLSSNSVL